MRMTNEETAAFKPSPGRRAGAMGPEVFDAAFSDQGDRTVVKAWLLSIEKALGIDMMLITDGDKLDRIGLLYPLDVLGSLAKRDGSPAGECLERLTARGFIVNAISHQGRNVILVAIPLDEAVRQAKIWFDRDGEPEGESVTMMMMTDEGMISGTMETL
jgi:hypothetical protein